MTLALRAARANVVLAPTGTLLAFAASVLVARWLGPEIYADYATLMALLAWLIMLAESGCNVGLSRYWAQAGANGARLNLYRTLQLRRWLITVTLTGALIMVGPLWARSAGLDVDQWGPAEFALVGILAAVMLHGQLASTALMRGFAHGRVLVLNQSATILRALALGTLAGMLREPAAMVAALLAVSVIESTWMHRWAIRTITNETRPMPAGMVTAAQRHGMVALFDKATTALSGGPFMLLVLAGAHGREELAMLAVAGDLLQKTLSVAGLPLSNLVLPMLSASREDPERYRFQVTRLGGLTLLFFPFAAGAIAVLLPAGLPLTFGPAYAPAVSLALLWLFPLFMEAAVRMVWGVALLTLDHHGWLMRFNFVGGLMTLMVVLLVRDSSLVTILFWLGMVRVALSLLLMSHARGQGLVPTGSVPIGMLIVCGIACLAALLLQGWLTQEAYAFQLAVGLSVYLALVLTCLRFFPLVPAAVRSALEQVAGHRKAGRLMLSLLKPSHA
jgi:O-antigen/teichoic acid export membrane protein